MPRRPDPDVAARILSAARRLWKKGGERALTMRAVAKAAGTNTPAVYRRFPTRQEILRALLRQVQRDVAQAVQPCSTPEEACEKYLEFALDHAHEYELFYDQAYRLPREILPDGAKALREERRTMALMEAKLAQRLGGSPSDHTRLSLALWVLSHGTAMILISESIPPEHVPELRSVFTATVAAMIQNARI
jgi:AcrR family transcriptional regulator